MSLKVGAICANVLTKVSKWAPGDRVGDELSQRCLKNIIQSNVEKSAVSAPLSFALARIGIKSVMKESLTQLISDTDWGDFDFREICNYYGSVEAQVFAIDGHFKNNERNGLLLAHDTHRLIRLREKMIDIPSIIEQIINPRLQQSISILHREGLTEEAKTAERRMRE